MTGTGGLRGAASVLVPAGRKEERVDVGIVRSGPNVVVLLRGELDFSSAGDLAVLLDGVVRRLRTGGGAMLVDASGLVFIDLTAFDVLAHAAERLGPGRTALVAATPIVLRVAELAERFLDTSLEVALARSA